MIAPVATFAAAICGPVEQQEAIDGEVTAPAITTVTSTPTTEAAATEVPTETPTSLAETINAATMVAGLPTPESDSVPMALAGTVWVDARPAYGELLALVDGTECGRGTSVADMHGGVPTFALVVLSAAEQPGCGTRGASVTITINGRTLNETVEWQPGFQRPVRFLAGPQFALYYGRIAIDYAVVRPVRVVPYVGGERCGEQVSWGSGNGVWSYQVVVDPAGVKAGCGVEDSQVTFRLETDAGAVIELGTEVWDTSARVDRALADLTVAREPSPDAQDSR